MSAFFKLIDGRLQRLERVPHVSNARGDILAAYAREHGFAPYTPEPMPQDGARYAHAFALVDGVIRDVWTPIPIPAAERIAALKQLLANTDYVAAKLAEVDGEQRSDMLAEYAEVLEQRRAWREEIGKLEKSRQGNAE